MPKWTDYTKKQTVSDTDEMMLLDIKENANKRVTVSDLKKNVGGDTNTKEELAGIEKKLTENEANTGRLEKQIEEITKSVGDNLKMSDVTKYIQENSESLLPDNAVLFEDTDDEGTITPESIIGEVLDKLDLKAVDDQTLGLYIGTKLISSVRLEEFKASEIICTGITLDPSNTTAYGKTKIEVIATTTPQDCTQKIRWFTTDADVATVSDGTVKTTGKKGSVTIYAICGNYRAECKIVITAYVYPEFNFQIGQVLETVGATYSRTADSAEMRISSDYMQTPVDTVITLKAGGSYLYQLYKYKDDKLDSFTSWISCTGTIEIVSEEFSGFTIKIRKNNYGKWTSDDIEAFTKTVTIESA
nr:Ig-like domain-containing protein [uncultured Blautia sp.]